MSIHEGHRARLKKQFMEYGADCLPEHSLLELLLFYVLPRRDTDALARALLSRFGSLAGVLDAKPSALQETPGIGSHALTLFALLSQLERRYRISGLCVSAPCLDTAEAAGEYLAERLLYEDRDVSLAVFLDGRCRVIGEPWEVFCAFGDERLGARQLVEQALACGAHAVLLAHSHPRSDTDPTEAELCLNRQIEDTLALVGISLLDHFIIAGAEIVPMPH